MTRVDIKCSEDFRELLHELVFERQNSGTDKKNKPISFEKLTKAIANMIMANPKMKKAITEVEINGK